MGSVRPADIPAPLADTTPVSTPPGWLRTTPESLAATAPVSALDSGDGHPSSPRLPAVGRPRTPSVAPVAGQPGVIAVSRRFLIVMIASVLALSAAIGVGLALLLGR
jgi:hypothetical protein